MRLSIRLTSSLNSWLAVSSKRIRMRCSDLRFEVYSENGSDSPSWSNSLIALESQDRDKWIYKIPRSSVAEAILIDLKILHLSTAQSCQTTTPKRICHGQWRWIEREVQVKMEEDSHLSLGIVRHSPLKSLIWRQWGSSKSMRKWYPIPNKMWPMLTNWVRPLRCFRSFPNAKLRDLRLRHASLNGRCSWETPDSQRALSSKSWSCTKSTQSRGSPQLSLFSLGSTDGSLTKVPLRLLLSRPLIPCKRVRLNTNRIRSWCRSRKTTSTSKKNMAGIRRIEQARLGLKITENNYNSYKLS